MKAARCYRLICRFAGKKEFPAVSVPFVNRPPLASVFRRRHRPRASLPVVLTDFSSARPRDYMFFGRKFFDSPRLHAAVTGKCIRRTRTPL